MQQTNANRLPFNPPGKKLGVYRFHNEIGRGNYGVVYLASDDKGNKYAIKSMKKEIFKENGGIIGDLIRNEKNALLKIKNKHIVRIFEYIESVNQAYMILELCDGGNFEGYLTYKKFEITVYEAVQYIKQIVQGVNALHEKKIIHRDLKLSNILMKDNSAVLKIADLGFCHILSDDESLVKLNLGTIGTKAPEIILNKPYDIGVDMFSTGVMFYQLLCCGNYPFQPTTEEEYLEQILKGRNLLKSIIADNIMFVSQNEVPPQDLQQLIRRMLHHNPEHRLKWSEIFYCSIFKQTLQLETHLGFNSRVKDVKKLQNFYIQNEEKIISLVSPRFADIGPFAFDEIIDQLSKEKAKQTMVNENECLSTVSFQNKDEIQQIQEENCNINQLFEKYLSKYRYFTLHTIAYELIHKTYHSNLKQSLFPVLMISKKISILLQELIKMIKQDGNLFNSPYYESLIVTDQWKVLTEELEQNKEWMYNQIQHNIKCFNININQKTDEYKLKYVQLEWLEEADVYFQKANFDNIYQSCLNRYISYLIGDIFQLEKDKVNKKSIIIYLIKSMRVNQIDVEDIPTYQLESLLQNKNVDKLFEESCSFYDQQK